MLGRKRKIVEREPNGRPKRAAASRIGAADRDSRLKETRTVLNQPHRRGDPDTRRISALGRFCQRNKVRPEIFDAVTDYCNWRQWWGRAVGRPKGLENASPRCGRHGDGPSDETVRGWLASYVGVDMMLQKRGGLSEFWRLVLNDTDPPNDAAADAALVATLRAVAVHMGRVTARDGAFV